MQGTADGEKVTAEIREVGKVDLLRIKTEEKHKFATDDLVDLSQFSESVNNGWAHIGRIVNNQVVEATRIKYPKKYTLSHLKYDKDN